MPAEAQAKLDDLLTRGDISGDLNNSLQLIAAQVQNLNRAMTSSSVPVRENLESEAKVLMPLETPLRNRIPRFPGAGTAAAWRQLTQLGSNTNGTGVQAFYSQSGAPANDDSVYASKSASYKLMGKMGGITGFAMAAGASYQNQLAAEKTNKLRATMLNEENAIINGSSSSTAAPWGDGTTAFGYDGLLNLITTGNGTPSGQVQTTVGALTIAHLDAQITLLWNQGAQGIYMIMSGTEVNSMAHLATGGTTPYRVVLNPEAAATGVKVSGYMHPIVGFIPIIPSRFLAAGTILYCASQLPDGSPALEVDVLPQVQLPELAPNENVQGYVAQEVAPSASSPQLYPFLVSVFSVLKMKSALHFAKSTGVTAV